VKHQREGKGGEQDVIQQPSATESNRGTKTGHKGAFPWHNSFTPEIFQFDLENIIMRFIESSYCLVPLLVTRNSATSATTSPLMH